MTSTGTNFRLLQSSTAAHGAGARLKRKAEQLHQHTITDYTYYAIDEAAAVAAAAASDILGSICSARHTAGLSAARMAYTHHCARNRHHA